MTITDPASANARQLLFGLRPRLRENAPRLGFYLSSARGGERLEALTREG